VELVVVIVVVVVVTEVETLTTGSIEELELDV
jgi:hypothetical protein